jgi:hypothetical protein
MALTPTIDSYLDLVKKISKPTAGSSKFDKEVDKVREELGKLSENTQKALEESAKEMFNLDESFDKILKDNDIELDPTVLEPFKNHQKLLQLTTLMGILGQVIPNCEERIKTIIESISTATDEGKILETF